MYLCRPLCQHISVFLVGSIISNHRCQDYEKYSGWTNIAEVRKGKCERTTRGLRKRTSNVTSKIAMVHLGCKQRLTHWRVKLIIAFESERTDILFHQLQFPCSFTVLPHTNVCNMFWNLFPHHFVICRNICVLPTPKTWTVSIQEAGNSYRCEQPICTWHWSRQ